jgi:hypothetical protein
MARLVQFMHPGSEPTVEAPCIKRWNTGEHRRSFLLSRGRYVAGPDDVAEKAATLAFWGEWEAPARTFPVTSKHARAIHLPCTPRYCADACLQNTDPFVFDGPFLYSCCKQLRRNGQATYLRNLSRGDVVLFGSHRSGLFLLDTVFVVRDSVAFSPRTAEVQLRGRVSESFIQATLKPLAPIATDSPIAERDADCRPEEWCDYDERYWCGPPNCAAESTFQLYWGATPSDPVDGMFSFAPATVYRDVERVAFKQPGLDDSLANIKGGMKSGFRDCVGEGVTGDQVPSLWRTLAELVARKGLVLGTSFKIDDELHL